MEMHLGFGSIEEALFAETERAQVTLNSIGDGVICTDASGNATYLNIVAEKLTGWPWREAMGKPATEILRLLDAKSRLPIADPMEIAVKEDRSVQLPSDVLLLRRDGSDIPIEDTVTPIHDREGRVSGAVIVFRDVTASRAMVQAMTHSATHDALTGLPNRILLEDRIGQAIAMASRRMTRLAVMFVDLDGFKFVNDSLGHSTGDKLLRSVAQRLGTCTRNSDTVSRQGGDEFVILITEVKKVEHLAATARRILKTVAEVHAIDGYNLRTTASIGVSVYPDDGVVAETLIRNADTAMYQAKESGRQGVSFFKSAMNRRVVERQSIGESLRHSLEKGELALHYQPKVDLATGQISGAEALLRWTHPTRGPIPPSQFIPVAEESGLILAIGSWVLGEACRQARAWQDAGFPAITIAANVSAVEFADESFLKGVLAALRETNLDPTRLELELTESVLMKRAGSAAAILRKLRDNGVRVAIDDFGTGYSSLSYLQKFPVNALKLDRSFVGQIGADHGDAPIVTAVIRMAHSLKLRVIAEGVETLAQLTFLRDQHCDEAQGYYFCHPLPAPEFGALLESGTLNASASAWVGPTAG